MTENSHTADRMDWCPECQEPVDIVDQFEDSIGCEEQERPVYVVALACGHSISWELKRRQF